MFLRKTSVKRVNATYTYIQLVESYRRSDGMPATRVVANLGQLTELEYSNFKTALTASKDGKTVVLTEGERPKSLSIFKPMQNLDYLDLALLLEIWREMGYQDFFQGLFNKEKLDIDATSILVALVLHRSIDPGSKLSATRWFPRTALPELLGVSTSAFNNSRIHRTLELLERHNPTVLAKMPYLAQNRSKPSFAAMFLDVTDAWFVGEGSVCAQMGKTKEGLLRRKIGIVLLCDDEGFPLRWEVVGGARHDSKTMTQMLSSIQSLIWVKQTPLICDRAMGKSAQIFDMQAMNIHFITAVTRTEYLSFAPTLNILAGGHNDDTLLTRQELVTAAQQRARAVGMTEIDEALFVSDLGLIKRSVILKSKHNNCSQNREEGRARVALRLCREMEQGVADGKFSSFRAAGAALGLHRGIIHRYRQLGHLPLEIQEQILAGEADGISIDELLAIAKMPFIEAVKNFLTAKDRPLKPRHQRLEASANPEIRNEIECRVIVYFNPKMYAEMHEKACKNLKKTQVFIADLNSRLMQTQRPRRHEKILAEVDRYLRRDNLLEIFDITLQQSEAETKDPVQVTLSLNEKNWDRRRRFDGFCVLACHPKIDKSAVEIAKLYRAKNTVEVDFRTIKNQMELRPIRHFTDCKVTAHVSICMLALALERRLKQKLNVTMTAEVALETLKTCRLNRYMADGHTLYTTTNTNDEQQQLLKRLNMEHLAKDDFLRERIQPRP